MAPAFGDRRFLNLRRGIPALRSTNPAAVMLVIRHQSPYG